MAQKTPFDDLCKVAGYHLIVLALWLTPDAVLAQDRYLDEMPPVETVLAGTAGSDPADLAARRHSAFYHLCEVIKDFAGPRRFNKDYTPQEKALLAAYTSAQNEAASEGFALIKAKSLPATGFDSAGPTWVRMRMHFEGYDYRKEVLEKFVSEDFREHYWSVFKAMYAGPGRGVVGGTPASTPNTPGNYGHLGPTAIWQSVTTELLPGLGLLLVLASYPLIAFWRTRRVTLFTKKGVVLGAEISDVTTTHTTSGHHNSQTGVYTPGSTTTTRSVSKEVFLQGREARFSVTLPGKAFSTEPGNPLTTVYAAPGKGKTGYPCHVFNHTSQRWLNIDSGLRWARGGSATTSLLWTTLLGLVFVAWAATLGDYTEALWIPITASLITYWLGAWICGALLIKFVHMAGDSYHLRLAKRRYN